jgi:hypothetical protein
MTRSSSTANQGSSGGRIPDLIMEIKMAGMMLHPKIKLAEIEM